MQDEAAIPEDIVDQQHILDGDIQYATEPEVTDIILETQSKRPKKLSLFDMNNDDSTNHNNNKESQTPTKAIINKSLQSKIYDKNVKNEKFQKKREEYKDEIAILHYNGNGDTEDVDDNVGNDESNNSEDRISDEAATVGKVKSEVILRPSVDSSIEKVPHKRFKGTKGETIGQQRGVKQQAQQQYEQQLQMNEQYQKQLHAILKSNKRKFNKVPSKKLEKTMALVMTTEEKANNGNTINNSDISGKRYDEPNSQDSHWSFEDNVGDDNVVAAATATARVTTVTPIPPIGDIEDNFRNEDETFASVIDGIHRVEIFENYYGSNNDDVDDSIRVNDKSVAATAATVSTTQISMNSDPELNGQQSSDAAVIVGKKIKRFNRVRTFNSGDYTHSNNHGKDGGHNGNVEARRNKHHKEYEIETAAAKKDDYKKERHDLRQNGSNTLKDTRNVSGQQQQQLEDEYAAAIANNGQTMADLATMRSGGSNQHQLQQQQNLKHESAFEEQKARRRNNRRNGHKSHKKRYKDYLRFFMTPVTTPTIIVPLATKTAITTQNRMLPAKNTNEQTTNAASSIQAATDADAGADADANTEQTFTNGTNNGEIEPLGKATLEKSANNLKQIFQNKHETKIENMNENVAATAMQRAEQLRKYARKFEAEKSRGLPAPPIFAVANRNAVSATTARPAAAPTKPFYEGQINYYMETKDDEADSGGGTGLLSDASNWYRRVSPVLRNGIKTSFAEAYETPFAHKRHHNNHHHHHQHHHHQQNHQYNHHQHENEHHQQEKNRHQHHHQLSQHSQHTHHKHQQTNKQYQSAYSNPYQRKLVRKPALSSSNSKIPAKSHLHLSTPLPPPAFKPHEGAIHELGHQITEMEELERYYAKWPHLARVQLQVYDEHFREQHPDIYPDYDQDYESAAELEEAQNANAEDANLPPYIKKYNRRNKQLLNLLEGTLPPPTKSAYFTQGRYGSLLQPGPHESSKSATGPHTVVRIDDDYMKEKRRRYHYRYGNGYHQGNNNDDLFAQQRNGIAKTNEKTASTPTPMSKQLNKQQNSNAVTQKSLMASTSSNNSNSAQPEISFALPNQLPEEDVSIRREEQEQLENGGMSVGEAADWQEEIETKSNGNAGDEMTGNVQMTWQIEKLTASPTSSIITTTTTLKPKSALFRLPSYPAISGSYIGKPRSRSSQFAPSNRANTLINLHRDDYTFEKTRQFIGVHEPPPPPQPSATQASGPLTATSFTPTPSKTINSFVYHRVVDSAPRFVGAGSTGLKQRLPFVAITDRRLETAKKTLLEHKKDLEQNFYPMP